MATNTDLNSEWNISSDVYDIARSIGALKQRYIDNKDETTLSLGIFGFISDLLSKEIQTDTIMTGIYGNEMFPARAQLTRNVLTHAIYNSIMDINAIPAKITVNIGLKVNDFKKYAIFKDNRYEFVFDHMCSLFIGDYEFHLDYDIILKQSATKENVFSAQYDMSKVNRISTVTQPYLNQPFVIRIGDFDYIVFQATLQQVTITEIHDKIISNSVVDNKTYTFSFPDQLVDFDVYVSDRNGNAVRVLPLLTGTIASDYDTKYCWYLFMSDNSIRISFDTKSFIPGPNSDIYIKVYTTLGKGGEFTYSKIDQYSEGFFVELKSDYLGYSNVNCYLIADSDSFDGHDRKTKEELQALIPKAAISRGSITTETDVANYFNLIDSPDNRLVMRKKIDNNIARVWYCYMLLKDELNNLIPTNDIQIRIDINADYMKPCDEHGRKVLPAGSTFILDGETFIATYCDPGTDTGDISTTIPVPYSTEEGHEYFNGKYYYYETVHNIVFNPNPLYTAIYMTAIYQQGYYICQYVNDECQLQFVANRFNFERPLSGSSLSDTDGGSGNDKNNYVLTYKIAQSIAEDFNLYSEEIVEEIDPVTGETIEVPEISKNVKCILVLYNGDNPYKWKECSVDLVNCRPDDYVYAFKCVLETDDENSLEFDDTNKIKLTNLNWVGFPHSEGYGYFDQKVKARIYTLILFKDSSGTPISYGRADLDSIAPGYQDYTVTNIYEVNDGLDLFEQYTGITNCRIRHVGSPESGLFDILNVPVVGYHYLDSEENARFFINAMSAKKRYILYCLELLENNMDIDYKFFNTYGPSRTYNIGNKEEDPIGDIDLCMKLRASLIDSSDVYTKEDIVAKIKEYMEDLYNIGSWHAPNMINALMTDYQFNTRCNFIEFMNYNNMRLGIQHIIENPSSVANDNPHLPPEFLNIRNKLDKNGTLVPDIEVEIVND